VAQERLEISLIAFRVVATSWLVYEAFFFFQSLTWMVVSFVSALVWATTSNAKLKERMFSPRSLIKYVVAVAAFVAFFPLIGFLKAETPITLFALLSIFRAGIGASLILFAASILWYTRLEELVIKKLK